MTCDISFVCLAFLLCPITLTFAIVIAMAILENRDMSQFYQ